MTQAWTDYAAQRPPLGVHQWRVPSKAVPGMHVLFYAAQRTRWSGYAEEESPHFDHWNGYTATVPAGTQWRTPAEPVVLPAHQSYARLQPEGLVVEPCPFCKAVPAWQAIEGGWGDGVTISAKPHNYNNWTMRCCGWAGKVPSRDPRKLTEQRAVLLAAYRATQTTPEEVT